MKITARVKPSSSRNEIRERPDAAYEIFVTAAPEKGRANRAAIELLSERFGVRKGAIRIVRGESSRDKIFEIGVIETFRAAVRRKYGQNKDRHNRRQRPLRYRGP